MVISLLHDKHKRVQSYLKPNINLVCAVKCLKFKSLYIKKEFVGTYMWCTYVYVNAGGYINCITEYRLLCSEIDVDIMFL